MALGTNKGPELPVYEVDRATAQEHARAHSLESRELKRPLIRWLLYPGQSWLIQGPLQPPGAPPPLRLVGNKASKLNHPGMKDVPCAPQQGGQETKAGFLFALFRMPGKLHAAVSPKGLHLGASAIYPHCARCGFHKMPTHSNLMSVQMGKLGREWSVTS